ncbi:MAG TPA: hypothetical protein VGD74_01650, partial [Vulgatibacter sp.]
PGVLAVEGPSFEGHAKAAEEIEAWCRQLEDRDLSGIPLVVLCDDAAFAAAHLDNLVWVAFTRSNPSHDVHGVGSFVEHKHWGCRGPLVIDARTKPHHAPPLEVDPEVERRVDALGARGGPLHGII